MKTTKHDDGLEWLHDIRARLAKQFDYNPRKAAIHYRRVQKASGAKIYQREEPVGSDVQTYYALHDSAHAQIAADQCETLTSYRAARKRKAKGAK
jgi:hypothetical protein